MPARREASDADVVRIDAPLLRFASHEADGALGIQERTGSGDRFRFSDTAWHPILEDDTSDSFGAEPLGPPGQMMNAAPVFLAFEER
jgi:hypothetical protein